MIKLAAGWTLAVALAVAAISSARAQEPDIQIAHLECNGDPERVVIENRGDADQALAGWQLQSDPPGSQVYDLSVRGYLVVGAEIIVQSGPSASGVFLQDNWGLEFVFRDDDPTDYVRLVDDTGSVVQQVHCTGDVVAQPSPTPRPQPAANDVPNGGGPPPTSSDALPATVVLLVGGSMAAAGLATSYLSLLRLHPSQGIGPTSTLTSGEARTARRRAQHGAPNSSLGEPISVGIGLAVMGLLATGVVFLLQRHRGA